MRLHIIVVLGSAEWWISVFFPVEDVLASTLKTLVEEDRSEASVSKLHRFISTFSI